MSHIGFRAAGSDVETSADYVVVGSGAGGAAAAVTLARGGASVCIVEAGPYRLPADYPESVYGAMRDMMDNWGTLLARGRAFWPIVQARLVGGTTVINSAIVVRTPGDVFADWQRDHGLGGDALAERVWTHQDRIEGELSVEETVKGVYGNSNRLAQAGAEALGIHGMSTEYLSQRQPFTVQDANQINTILRDCNDCWAHNAPFDKEVLDRAFDLVGKVFFPFRNLACTQAVAKQHGLPQKLDDLYRHFFRCDREQPHRADDDAIDLAHIFKAMKERGLLSSRSRFKRR